MEITNSILVVMMFVVLLTMGIGNIVTSLATTVDRRSPLKFDALHTSWTLLLLFMFLNLFWHVLDILVLEEWVFRDFLYVVGGAVIMLFAAQVLLTDPSSESATNLRQHYFDVSRQFFFFLLLLQLWGVGVDFLLGRGFTSDSALSVATGTLFLVMSLSQSEKLHKVATVIACVLVIASLVLQGVAASG